MKKIANIVVALLIVALAGGLLYMSRVRSKAAPEAGALSPLAVHLLKVGKADAFLLQESSNFMMIDAGEEDDGQEIVDQLLARGATRVDTLIITHYDKDHVGGADTLLEQIPVDTVIAPAYEGSIADYTEFMAALEVSKKKNGTKLIELSEDLELTFGSAELLIEPPASYELLAGAVEADNDFSLITTLTHGENTLLFMGDAEKALIRGWLAKDSSRDCDFLKVPHHGVYTAAYAELFEATAPELAAICTSSKNPADDKTIELMKAYGIRTYETRAGDITLASDGRKLKIEQ